jgi:hypothetical protein
LVCEFRPGSIGRHAANCSDRRGLRSREAVKVRRSEEILADAGAEESTRGGTRHRTLAQAGDIIADGKKVV